MCSRGVWQLQHLTFCFSPKHPASLGVRQFIESDSFKEFVEKNPQLQVHQYQTHTVSPYVMGSYVDNKFKRIPVNMASSNDVKRVAFQLRNERFRPAAARLKKWHQPRSKIPSVQGVWEPDFSSPQY